MLGHVAPTTREEWLAEKCPRCGSTNAECVRKGKQLSARGLKSCTDLAFESLARVLRFAEAH